MCAFENLDLMALPTPRHVPVQVSAKEVRWRRTVLEEPRQPIAVEEAKPIESRNADSERWVVKKHEQRATSSQVNLLREPCNTDVTEFTVVAAV